MPTFARGTLVTSTRSDHEGVIGRVSGHDGRKPVVAWLSVYGDSFTEVTENTELVPAVTLPAEALDAEPGQYVDGGRNHFIVKAPADRPGTRAATGVDMGGVYEFNGVGLSKDAARHVAGHLLKFAARS